MWRAEVWGLEPVVALCLRLSWSCVRMTAESTKALDPKPSGHVLLRPCICLLSMDAKAL